MNYSTAIGINQTAYASDRILPIFFYPLRNINLLPYLISLFQPYRVNQVLYQSCSRDYNTSSKRVVMRIESHRNLKKLFYKLLNKLKILFIGHAVQCNGNLMFTYSAISKYNPDKFGEIFRKSRFPEWQCLSNF